ncbi:MAG: terpene cyclase/mutase family protein [Phycisphaerales bacterium]|nr:terpene cyclase/mutase family protein [Phycisphaerales bacterium]
MRGFQDALLSASRIATMTSPAIMAWQRASIERLLASARPDGGWGYQSNHEPSAEPTAFACLALAMAEPDADPIQLGLEWLARGQHDNGAVAVAPRITAPCWPTSLAALAWLKARSSGGTSYPGQTHRAVDWLLHTEGLTLKSDAAIYGHDTQMIGWPWVSATHSWIEPTAYSVLALCAAGKSNHPRVREAVKLLLNRAIPEGGWNYGNSRVFQNNLRPFPAQTGIALAALAGEAMCESIDSAIRYLHSELERIRTPMSLGWGVIGLSAWNERPFSADDYLTECAARLDGKPNHPVFDSLLLLADAEQCTLTTLPEAANHG